MIHAQPDHNPMESLRAEHETLASLVALMQAEQAHLVAADIEALQAITEQKAQVVAKASEMAQNRHRQLAIAGFAPEEAGMQAWLASINSDSVAEAWQQLLDISRAAKELNRVNGILINKQMSYNQTAIDSLHAPAQAKSPSNVYGKNGQTATTTNTRRIVVG
jgi:flagella synthesis protein FlgN